MKQVWAMSVQEYIKRTIQNVECKQALRFAYLPKRIEIPLSHGYIPELDFSNELKVTNELLSRSNQGIAVDC